MFGQAFGQCLRGGCGVDVGDVPEFLRLLRQGRQQGGMAVAECVYGNAAGQVDVLAPFGIPYAAALSAFGDDGGEVEVGGQVVLPDAVRVLSVWTGDYALFGFRLQCSGRLNGFSD